MVAYTNDESRVRFPMVPVRRETAYYQGIRFTAPYLWAFGQMEIVYPGDHRLRRRYLRRKVPDVTQV